MNNEEQILALLGKVNTRLDSIEKRMDSMEHHMLLSDERLDSLEHRMDRTEALLLAILKKVEQNSLEIRRINLTLENETNKKITALFDGRDFCLLHQKEFQQTTEVVENHEIRIFALEHKR